MDKENIKFFSVTPENYKSTYFDLVQNDRFKTLINPGLKKCSYFQSGDFSLNDYNFFGYYLHDTKEIIACGFIGAYKGYEFPNSLCYIWVDQAFRANGLATEMMAYIYNRYGNKLSITGFSPYGYKYLRPKLQEKGYVVDDHVSFWPNTWSDQKIRNFKTKHNLE